MRGVGDRVNDLLLGGDRGFKHKSRPKTSNKANKTNYSLIKICAWYTTLLQLQAQLTPSQGDMGHRRLCVLNGCNTKIKRSVHSDEDYFDERRNRLSSGSKQMLIF